MRRFNFRVMTRMTNNFAFAKPSFATAKGGYRYEQCVTERHAKRLVISVANAREQRALADLAHEPLTLRFDDLGREAFAEPHGC